QSFRLGQLLGTGDLTLQLALIPLGSASVLLSFVYYVGFWLLAGQTPGKAFLGVAVVRADGGRLRAGAAIVRWLGYWLSGILFLGYLWILVDNRRQAWHDKLARTLVVYRRRGERGLSLSGQAQEYLRDWQSRMGAAETTRSPSPEE
ncbi:MAG: RDD family protein, partial [Anaerolineae bacterium]